MTPSLEGLPTKAKVAPSSHEVRMALLDTNPVFQCLGEGTTNILEKMMKISICCSISWFDLWPLLDLFARSCNYSVYISIQVMHHLLCSFIPFLWRELYGNFDHLLYFPSGVFNKTCKLSMWVFDLLFNSFIKGSHKIVKLQQVTTKHICIYFRSRLLIEKLSFC